MLCPSMQIIPGRCLTPGRSGVCARRSGTHLLEAAKVGSTRSGREQASWRAPASAAWFHPPTHHISLGPPRASGDAGPPHTGGRRPSDDPVAWSPAGRRPSGDPVPWSPGGWRPSETLGLAWEEALCPSPDAGLPRAGTTVDLVARAGRGAPGHLPLVPLVPCCFPQPGTPDGASPALLGSKEPRPAAASAAPPCATCSPSAPSGTAILEPTAAVSSVNAGRTTPGCSSAVVLTTRSVGAAPAPPLWTATGAQPCGALALRVRFVREPPAPRP
mmetsp:Transcript_12737/g.28545  ORF Transcript_12737/g.28545 Transcript_12737/m.28545 type:complete len:273 (-) Transcript_12737:83-901(-)